MNEVRDDWREMLEPPPGGLARLIGSIESTRARNFQLRPRFAFAAVGATLAIAAVCGVALHAHWNSPEYRLRNAIEAALRPAADGPGIQVENGAALEIPSADPNVRIYWIAQLPAATKQASAE